MHTGVHRFLASKLLVNPLSSGTLAFSLRLAPFLSDSDSPALHTGSSASPSLAHSLANKIALRTLTALPNTE